MENEQTFLDYVTKEVQDQLNEEADKKRKLRNKRKAQAKKKSLTVQIEWVNYFEINHNRKFTMAKKSNPKSFVQQIVSNNKTEQKTLNKYLSNNESSQDAVARILLTGICRDNEKQNIWLRFWIASSKVGSSGGQ